MIWIVTMTGLSTSAAADSYWIPNIIDQQTVQDKFICDLNNKVLDDKIICGIIIQHKNSK